MEVLVTGGAGYIASHTVIELMSAGYQPVLVDNFSNSKPEALRRVAAICGAEVPFYCLDVCDRDALREVMRKHDFVAAIHFAGLKAVGESCAQPLRYYHNNVEGSIALAEVMEEFAVRKVIFSSSATVYGDPDSVPIKEDFPTRTTNPYGASKLMVEDIYRDLCKANAQWSACLLRYFNPVGAHHSGSIGEDPKGIPNNLLPYISQVAVGKLKQLQIFGGDYPTVDGTGVRDYIHVVDLAKGHVAALNYLLKKKPASYTFNLGTGQGYSVLQMVAAFQSAAQLEIPYAIVERRAGDIAECYAEPKLALDELGWQAELDLATMVADTWRWQSANPNGYEE